MQIHGRFSPLQFFSVLYSFETVRVTMTLHFSKFHFFGLIYSLSTSRYRDIDSPQVRNYRLWSNASWLAKRRNFLPIVLQLPYLWNRVERLGTSAEFSTSGGTERAVPVEATAGPALSERFDQVCLESICLKIIQTHLAHTQPTNVHTALTYSESLLSWASTWRPIAVSVEFKNWILKIWIF